MRVDVHLSLKKIEKEIRLLADSGHSTEVLISLAKCLSYTLQKEKEHSVNELT